jgi:hypothetical protein
LKNEEVGTRRTFDSRITTNKVLIPDTSYLILFPMSNTERRLKNEEVEIRET